MVLANLCFMVFCGNLYAVRSLISTRTTSELTPRPKQAGISSGLIALVQDFHSDFHEASKIIAYCVLCLGLGAFLWIPTAVVIGKRPVLLASQVMFMAGCIWATQATSMNSLLGSRILGALGAGAVQAVGPAVIGGESNATLYIPASLTKYFLHLRNLL